MALGDRGALTREAAAQLSAQESGRVFSLHRVLLVLFYGCVAAIVTGAGLLVKAHLDRIGPLTLLATLLLAAALCYAFAIRNARQHATRTLAGDYVLLLGSLLLSSAAAFGQIQFHWLGEAWPRHLLLLAAVHAFTAYALDSRLVLSVALTSFAAWMGVETGFGDFWSLPHVLTGAALRGLACAALILIARECHRRLSRRDFLEVFDHFAANLAFWGTLALIADPARRGWGALLLPVLALFVGRRGYILGREILVLYALGYTALGLWLLVAKLVESPLLSAMLGLGLIITVAILLQRLRSRMKVGAP